MTAPLTPPPLPSALRDALAGSYELIHEIGRGGMGIVYAARDIRLDRLVAIKVLPDLVSDDVVRGRFLREARAAARLSHPSIVPIYAADERNGVTFIVMAYVDGPTLSSRIRLGGMLLPADAVPIVRDVALALGAAHARGVVHRDVKPENILIDRSTGHAMVTDFGIARLADAFQGGALTRTGQVLGTVGYMSPEQVTAGDVDGRSDLYSLGVVAFEALSGRLPFQGPAPAVIVAHATKAAPLLASVAPQLPATLCDVVDRCLRKEPSERFATGDALAAALEEAVGERAAMQATRIAQREENRVLSESEAERVWHRAAELQAGIAATMRPRAPTATTSAVPRTATNGFLLQHVRDAALEAGISASYVSLALDELGRRHSDVPDAVAASAGAAAAAPVPAPIPPTRSLSPRAPLLAGAPMALAYEVELPGQLSPHDFDVVAHTIRARLGEPGIATALGRTLGWSSGDTGGGKGDRRVYISISAAGGRTQIRVEERLGPLAGGLFGGIVGGAGGGIVGGAGGGIGGGTIGFTIGALHSPLLALIVSGGAVLGAYATARTIFTNTVRGRARELESLTDALASQIAGLIAAAPG